MSKKRDKKPGKGSEIAGKCERDETTGQSFFRLMLSTKHTVSIGRWNPGVNVKGISLKEISEGSLASCVGGKLVRRGYF